jgi:GNAT superfamily N-acetyltransferase
MIKSFRLFNESIHNIQYSKEVDEDGDNIEISAYLDGSSIAKLSFEILYDAYEYEFSDDFTEDEFDAIYTDVSIVKLSHIEVNKDYMREGVAKKLISYGISLMIKEGYNEFFLNASPMGFRGMRLQPLIEFYKSFGFREILNQGNNSLMALVIK